MDKAILFQDDDDGYLKWLEANPSGYILNARINPDPGYLVLHKAHCKAISTYGDMAKPGGFTERAYIKVCSTNMRSIVDWIKRNGREDRSFSKVCSKCI